MAGSASAAAAAAIVGMEESDSTCQLLILGTPPSDRERQTVRGGRQKRPTSGTSLLDILSKRKG